MSGVRFFSAGPLSVLAVILLIGLIIILIPLLILGIIGVAFTRLGFSWITALAVVFLMLFGSFINIPVYMIRREMVRTVTSELSGITPSGSWAALPVWDTRISVNLGGGILPVCISLYLLYQAAFVSGMAIVSAVSICAVLVAALTRLSTRSLPGTGIRVPVVIPALAALLIGVLINGGPGLAAGVTALAGGVLGTLVGGNLMNLFRIRDLEVPEVSIGGYGTFGAVFLCCLLPALVA
jgi:uncharacterized membrane protein